jgi:hypothetical protein
LRHPVDEGEYLTNRPKANRFLAFFPLFAYFPTTPEMEEMNENKSATHRPQWVNVWHYEMAPQLEP